LRLAEGADAIYWRNDCSDWFMESSKLAFTDYLAGGVAMLR
jgi:hypothetical protein